jgi:protein TonB
VDSAAAPGAGTSEPPRYEAGGKSNPWPRYPAAARRRGIEGEVLVEVRVGADGAPAGVEILRSSGSALLDAAAVEALERWRFEPARSGGRPVAGTVEIPVTFKLTEPDGS